MPITNRIRALTARRQFHIAYDAGVDVLEAMTTGQKALLGIQTRGLFPDEQKLKVLLGTGADGTNVTELPCGRHMLGSG